ncbi:hypothetical protein HK102_000333, partial [Quaeritorhiza haematococci]
MAPTRMHALVLEVADKGKAERGGERYDPLILKEVPVPAPQPDEYVIRLAAAALNRRDVFIREGLYPRITSGSILGSDGSGVVVSAPSDGSSTLPPGTPVILNPSCNWDQDPRAPERPEKYGMLGLLPFPGTLAEYITIKKDLVHKMPAHLTFEQAAALPLAGLTAFRATFTKGQVKKDDVVLITGIGGGVALFALQFAVAAGAKVFVTSSEDVKIERAIKLGAVGGVNYKKENWIKTLHQTVTSTGHTGIDVVIDGAGGDENMQAFLKCVRHG